MAGPLDFVCLSAHLGLPMGQPLIERLHTALDFRLGRPERSIRLLLEASQCLAQFMDLIDFMDLGRLAHAPRLPPSRAGPLSAVAGIPRSAALYVAGREHARPRRGGTG